MKVILFDYLRDPRITPALRIKVQANHHIRPYYLIDEGCAPPDFCHPIKETLTLLLNSCLVTWDSLVDQRFRRSCAQLTDEQ